MREGVRDSVMNHHERGHFTTTVLVRVLLVNARTHVLWVGDEGG
jgi:hypothetical protein